MNAEPAPAWPALGVAARGVLRRADGAILLVRRAPGSTFNPGRWELPGGKMQPGERLDDALAREVLEETGLRVRGAWPFHVTHFVKAPFWVTSVAFVCAGFDGEVVLSPEHDAHAWMSPAALDAGSIAPSDMEHLAALADMAGPGPATGPGGRARPGRVAGPGPVAAPGQADTERRS